MTVKKLLGPKTKECESKRAIDTALIMGLGKAEKNVESCTFYDIFPFQKLTLKRLPKPSSQPAPS